MGRYYKVAFLFIGLLLTFESHAQKFKNSVYGELLGHGGFYSINYERQVLAKDKLFLAPSIGFSTYDGFTGVPILMNAYYGGPNHALEAGIGYLGFHRQQTDIMFEVQRFFDHYINSRLGYRYESDKGFLFKIAFTPLYLLNSGDPSPNSAERSFVWSGGISFGKSF